MITLLGTELGTERQARISLHYAEQLTNAARNFGAKTKHEAQNRPEGFRRPVVGHDPDYYLRAGGKVLRRAIEADPELGSLYSRAWLLSSDIGCSVASPYTLPVPQVRTSQELSETILAIETCLLVKDLKLPLRGKPLERAVNISAFAIRVITGDGVALQDDRARGLYPGFPADLPVNTVEYWSALHQQLTEPQA